MGSIVSSYLDVGACLGRGGDAGTGRGGGRGGRTERGDFCGPLCSLFWAPKTAQPHVSLNYS